MSILEQVVLKLVVLLVVKKKLVAVESQDQILGKHTCEELQQQ